MKPIRPETVDNLIKATHIIFPDWSGFLDPRFEKEEIGYKKKAVGLAQALLQKADLELLIDKQQFEEIRKRLMDIAQTSKLLFLSVPMKGDMSVIFADNLNQVDFYRAFIELLYGAGLSSERLEAFSAYLTANNLPNKWTFPTFFLFLIYPESDMYVRPMTTKWFLEMSGVSDTFPTVPNGEAYQILLDACHQVWDGVSHYHPRDYIDIQSLIWTGFYESRKTGYEKTPFNLDTFALLTDLHANPTKKFLDEHRQELSEWVQTPFRQLMLSVIGQLKPSITELMETEKGVFARFQKNDFGQGGAYDFYWGAFYPKLSRRTNDAQLWMSIDKNGIRFGFSIADFAPEIKKRFCAKWLKNRNQMVNMISQIESAETFYVDPSLEVLPSNQEPSRFSQISDLLHWLDTPTTDNISIFIKIDKVEVINSSFSELSTQIGACFNYLFPFVLLTIHDDPIPEIEAYLEIQTLEPPNSNYTLEQCAHETGFTVSELRIWIKAIERKKQAIFYGPPGTGKTFMAEKLAAHLVSGGDGFFELVQFHPEVSYEDFIQGIRPKASDHGGLDYPVVPGRFLEFCTKAESRQGTCVLIIDEINRANLARVFGELMYLLEYREKSVRLAAGGTFKIPDNVRIIGTMNTADRSIALVDHALRRRFAFLALYPNCDILRKFHEREKTGFNVEGLISVLKDLNQQIGDRHYSIGPSYFLRTDLTSQIEDIWHMEIEPYLEEYFFDQPDKVQQFLWDKQAEKILK